MAGVGLELLSVSLTSSGVLQHGADSSCQCGDVFPVC